MIVPNISVHLRRKSAIYISALYMLRYSLACSVAPRKNFSSLTTGLVCSVAPRKNFSSLTTVPKFQRNGSTDTSRAMDGFFPVWLPCGRSHCWDQIHTTRTRRTCKFATIPTTCTSRTDKILSKIS